MVQDLDRQVRRTANRVSNLTPDQIAIGLQRYREAHHTGSDVQEKLRVEGAAWKERWANVLATPQDHPDEYINALVELTGRVLADFLGFILDYDGDWTLQSLIAATKLFRDIHVDMQAQAAKTRSSEPLDHSTNVPDKIEN